MKTLVIILLVFGALEIVSNLYHILQGSKEEIGASAKKQHQELPADAGLKHFFYKAVIMLVLGILFLTSSLVYLLVNTQAGIVFTCMNAGIMSFYGLVQLIIYRKTIKVWTSFLIYSVPLMVLVWIW